MVVVIASTALLMRAAHRRRMTDWGHPVLNFLDGLNRLFCERFHRFEYQTLDLPERAGAVLVSNHVSGLDPLLLAAASPRPLRFIIAREQYVRPGLHWLFRAIGCIPVDRGGRPERALREAMKRLAGGEVVAIFPHGKIHLDGDPPRPIKRGAIRLACRGDRSLHMARISGVRGEGQVLGAVWKRSRARLVVGTAITCRGRPEDEVAAELQRYLDGSLDGGA